MWAITKHPNGPVKSVWTPKSIRRPRFISRKPAEKGFVFEFSEIRPVCRACAFAVEKGKESSCRRRNTVTRTAESTLKASVCSIQTAFANGIFTSKGEDVEEYIPSFTYHGARCFLVIGADKEQISEDTVTMLVQNSDVHERGSFFCSDPGANALQKSARTGDLANLVHIPTDCPHREKNGWTGDAAVSAEHMIQNLSVERVWKHWLKMIRAAQRADGVHGAVELPRGYGFTHITGADDLSISDRRIYALQNAVYTVCKKK